MPCNSPQQHTTSLIQFSTAAFELCPLYCFRKRYVGKMAKNEVANISRCYVPNLWRYSRLWPYGPSQESSRPLTQSSTGLCYLEPSPLLRYDLSYCLHNWYIMSQNNLGYETCWIMVIKMTAKSKFSPRSSKNGAIGLNTPYSFLSSALNPLTLNWSYMAS